MLCITHLGLLRQAPSSAGSSEKAKQETSLHGTLKLMKGRAVSELLQHNGSSVSSQFLPMGLAHSQCANNDNYLDCYYCYYYYLSHRAKTVFLVGKIRAFLSILFKIYRVKKHSRAHLK